MRITFAGTPICTLATTRGTDGPQDYSIDTDCSEQVVKYLRATSAKVFNRGNKYTTVAFKVFRSHGTVQAAETFCNTHRASLPDYGNYQAVSDDGSGQQTRTIVLANALLKKCKATYKGSNSTTDYTFTGGQVTLPAGM